MVDQTDGTLDLSKELSCSICTDVFYQPLTLLDCLHTFCGSCLKEWFSWQASSATSEHPYTCPACRAAVRGTKPNATVTTLLDMLLKAHPDKGKSQEDKEQISMTYKPGDNVIPPVRLDRDSDASEDERVLEEVRAMSLEQTNSRAPERARASSSGYRRHRGHQRPEHSASAQSPATTTPQMPRLDHQASLRSLLSASEPDSLAMQEEIMHQIMDEGLLDGVDLNNLTPAQEEDITERIARAFRRRQTNHSNHHHPRTSSRHTPPPHEGESLPSIDHHSPSSHALLDSDQPRSRRRRTSSQPTRTGARSASAVSRSDDALTPRVTERPTGTSNNHPSTSHPPPHRLDGSSRQTTRRTTDPASGTRTLTLSLPSSAHPRQARPRHVSRHSESPNDAHRLSQTRQDSRTSPLLALRSAQGLSNSSSPALLTGSTAHNSATELQRPSSSTVVPNNLGRSTAARPIPTVSCYRCKRSDIALELHYHCTKCSSGHFDLCLPCYRAGKGCYHWYGFGGAAFVRYERLLREQVTSDHETPHVLSARQYKSSSGSLQEGLFCEGCLSFTDDCYWHCDVCNDGAWGFCNGCVQKARHCTHPLQCVARSTAATQLSISSDDGLHPPPLHTTKSASHFALSSRLQPLSCADLPHVLDPSRYVVVALSVHCDLCERSIPPSHTRYHCHVCNDGNYDICASCYSAAGVTGRMKPEDGPQRWRRCPRGHRMSIVGFEDREGGPKRLVVRDFVGGWALKEDGHNTSVGSTQSGPLPTGEWRWKEEDGTPASQTSTMRQATIDLIPPDGGVGLKAQALWSRFPDAGVQDELSFPRNAVITEVEDINGDWYWGVYAGRKGLFPGNFVRVI